MSRIWGWGLGDWVVAWLYAVFERFCIFALEARFMSYIMTSAAFTESFSFRSNTT